MKNLLKKSAPRPSADFAQQLEQKLLAHGTWTKKPSSFQLSRFMKRYSLISASSLLLLAVAAGLLYPLAQQPKDFLAEATAFYESYEPDGILYQKKQIYVASPKETYDADATYTMETWNFEGNDLILTEKISGDMWEMVSSDELRIIDEYGNAYMYADPKEYATKKSPLTKSPYCVQILSAEDETEKTISSHAFEVSPQALDAYNTVYLSYLSEDRFTSFDHYGEMSDLIYIGSGGEYTYKKPEFLESETNSEFISEVDLRQAIVEADYAPEQAKILFDLLSSGQAYTQKSAVNDDGETIQVFRLPPEPYNPEYSDAKSIEEFVFNNQYELLEYNAYKDDKLMAQTKYLETRVLPVSEKEAIFNPEAYGFKLVSFEHPLNLDMPFLTDSKSDELSCYSFQNKLLSDKETKKLAEEYAPMIENIKALWKPF